MNDDQQSPDSHVVEPLKLRVRRFEQHGDSNIAWTTQKDLLRYLKELHRKGKSHDNHKSR